MKNCKGIVSFMDLQAEYESILDREGFIFDDVVYRTENNELKDDLNSLIEFGAMFVGNRIKCKSCGSAHWYGLNDLKNQMSCKGCSSEIKVNAEETPYYKINDVIRNNLNSNSGTSSNIHGNLTVLYTLLEIKEQSFASFIAIPQQNYFKPRKTLHTSDIDIVCISDGHLIIGEAKNSVKEFNRKEIDNLIFLGNAIRPDKILLAYNDGDGKKLQSVIEQIRDGLINKSILIETHKVQEPCFFSRNERLLKLK